jgi:hypothetical protein
MACNTKKGSEIVVMTERFDLRFSSKLKIVKN